MKNVWISLIFWTLINTISLGSEELADAAFVLIPDGALENDDHAASPDCSA